jgi:toxin ParE1/3/4
VKARFTPRARDELIEIADYIRQFSPPSATRVRDEIRRTIALLERFPFSGTRTEVDPVRKVVVRRYPYIIYYLVDAERSEVVILAIHHGARRQPFESE